MQNQGSDQKIIQDIRRELDRSCEQLDAATLSRLNRIRHEAIETSQTGFHQWRVFAGSAFVACVLVLLVTFYFDTDNGLTSDELALTELEAMEILSAEESLEFYEDIEFYQWLSMNEDL